MAEGRLGGAVAAQAVDAPARRCGRRTDEEAFRRSRVRIETYHGACVKLPNVLNAPVDISANVIGVVLLHRGRAHNAARKNPLPKARRESLDLSLDAIGHIPG